MCVHTFVGCVYVTVGFQQQERGARHELGQDAARDVHAACVHVYMHEHMDIHVNGGKFGVQQRAMSLGMMSPAM